MDAEATGVNLMDNDNPVEGARSQLGRLGMAGWEHGDGRMVAWGGLHGYYNHFEYNGTLWLHRSVSADEEGEAPYEGVHARMGDAAASIAWGSSTAYAYFRRMQRLLGRQFASEHKARRKKYIGTNGSTGAREGSVGGTGDTYNGVQRAVLGAVTLASFGLGGMWLRDVLGIYSNFDLRPGVNTLGGVAVSGAVTCNSESWLLQQRNVAGSVTLGRVEAVAGGRRVPMAVGISRLGVRTAGGWATGHPRRVDRRATLFGRTAKRGECRRRVAGTMMTRVAWTVGMGRCHAGSRIGGSASTREERRREGVP
jgi:hypothetical protein